MMGHILIFMYMIALLIGTWSAFYTHQVFKIYRLQLLRHFLNYTIFYNLSLLVYQISGYVFFNILGSETANFPPGLRVVMYLLGFMVEIGMTYSLVNTSMRLLGKESLKRIDYGYVVGISLFGISFIIGLTIFIQTGSLTWITTTYFVMFIAAIVVIYSTLIVSAFYRRSEQSSMKRRTIDVFVVLYFLKFTFMGADLILPTQIVLYFVATILILANFIPIYWLKQFFTKYYVNINGSATESILERFSQEYRISKREREIVELILKGKSNKEIQDILFISFSTVKNHIYTIYQKMGINSRSQLMHMVMELSKSKDAQ